MFLFQSIIVFLLHIFIPFRMCQQRIITFLLNALQNGQKIHRRVEVGGLHQQKTFSFFQKKQILFLQSLFKKIIKHIFRSKLQLHRATVLLQQFPELTLQRKGLVGDVFHDVGCEPYSTNPLLLHFPQNLQRLFHRLYTVVYSGKQVTMAIHHTFE